MTLTDAPSPHRGNVSALTLLAAALLTLLGPLAAAAQRPQPPAQPPSPLEQHLFPPELVMGRQSELGLTQEQRQQLIQEVQALQSDLVPLQFEMGQATEELARQLQASPVDEATALARAEKVTDLEAQVKRRHLALLIRIKNLLTAEQQESLRQLRAAK